MQYHFFLAGIHGLHVLIGFMVLASHALSESTARSRSGIMSASRW